MKNFSLFTQNKNSGIPERWRGISLEVKNILFGIYPAFQQHVTKFFFRKIFPGYSSNRLVLFIAATFVSLHASFVAAESEFGLRPEIRNFVAYMANRHGYDSKELESVFAQTNFRSDILKLISTPASAISWDEYRKRFVNTQRIKDGIGFWDRYTSELERARKIYGVPEEIIVAIIGVETSYGAATGNYRIMDALTTLAFDYPRRADFFREELENYLLLAKEQKFGLLDIKGSYAGAIGIPQFMPGSYRRYAVDFNNDGKIDLSGSAADAIGSVGHYLKEYGWEADEPIAVRAQARSENLQEFLDTGIEPIHPIEKLREARIIPLEPIANDMPSALLELNSQGARQFWLGFRNFYVITRYNRSTFYAMSVFDLAKAIKIARLSQAAGR